MLVTTVGRPVLMLVLISISVVNGEVLLSFVLPNVEQTTHVDDVLCRGKLHPAIIFHPPIVVKTYLDFRGKLLEIFD
jgi:hypothetical protein